jgi:O-6-methylguanine DNA methyltransferase
MTRYLPDLLNGLTLIAGEHGIREICFGHTAQDSERDHPALLEAERQLREYFAGARFDFDFPLELIGTPFQLAVWKAVAEIPYGETRSYRDIAQAVGSPKGFRAMGHANGRNPVPIVIPCHRVINTGGALGGYGGGLDIKRKLLSLEQNHAGLFRHTTS